ncbi:hypothetical protein OS175_02060 [Marinicella sp. S1101]|uniref:hypothetical protein n=1 Tax=Marinicella marina TaxID=2996016 RepID=UPI0022608A39|nr:hypothetical protein [Marinicella marina]MCX7552649.1 hypothetical protein [Marinicella marina]MDJ1139525.1 hypothetical protein [Marinicella marina]
MEFEFNFGEQQISKPAPLDNTLYASVSGTVQQLSQEELVFMDHQEGVNHVMTLQVLQAMGLTQQFKPMHEHVNVIEANIAELKGQQEAIKKVLGFLKNKGLLVSADDWLAKIKSQHQQSREVPYAGMVIRTCQRPENLQRLLESLASYEESETLDKTVLVFDDSPDVKSQEANQKICMNAEMSVKYHGQSWQNQFIGMLCDEFEQDRQSIEWLLTERDGFTGGRVWNLALLALAGKKFTFYDDDYLIQPRKAANHDVEQINLSDHASLDVGFGLSVRDIKEKSAEVESPIMAQMISACGDHFGHWLNQENQVKPTSLYGWRLIDLDRLNENSLIKSTGNGTWGSPRSESNYWLYLLEGEQREAFWQDRETYLENIEASHLMHYSPNYQALRCSNFAPSAIDNSTLTPFAMPINKNEDHFFNCMMLGCYPDQVSLHFPFMMGHLQVSTRDRSSFNHIARRPNFNSFVADYISSIFINIHSRDVNARFTSIKAAITDLQTGSDQALANRLQEYMTKTRSDLVMSLQNILDQVPDAPIYWQADVREIVQANGKAIKSNQSPVLSDWDETMDLESCIAKIRHDLKEVVDAMDVWPKLWAFCLGQ